MNLSEKALALAFGILSGGLWFVVMGLSLLTGWWAETVTTWGSFHPGFAYTWGGWVWMWVWHFIAGFVLGWLFGWLYNWALKKWK